jgi:hypothetical protein
MEGCRDEWKEGERVGKGALDGRSVMSKAMHAPTSLDEQRMAALRLPRSSCLPQLGIPLHTSLTPYHLLSGRSMNPSSSAAAATLSIVLDDNTSLTNVDEDFDGDWESTSDETSSEHIEENHHDGSVYSEDSEAPASDDHGEGFLHKVSGNSSLPSPFHNIRAKGTEDSSDSEWIYTSDEADAQMVDRRPTEDRPNNVPVATETWTVTPKAWFRRESPGEEDMVELCDQCAKIDFEAIFRLDPLTLPEFGNWACTFSGLSRSMLTSKCPACRVFGVVVYTEHKQSDEAALELREATFKGHLVAISSEGLNAPKTGYDAFSSQDPTHVPVILMIELLMSPLSDKARLRRSVRYLNIWSDPCWGYARARGAILPATMTKSVYINPKHLNPEKGFCYGVPLEGSVDFHLVSTMLHRCERLHPACHTDDELSFPQNARVIDCKTRRVVPMVSGLRYIALSYVWGAQKDANDWRAFDNSMLSGYLPTLLPRLIEDVLIVTVRLGYRYLWVDFYCIDQGHYTDKAFQIQQMANIYGHASATICALAAHPHIGLPGISHSRPTSESFRSQGITYYPVPEPEFLQRILQSSAWNSRGWTFQEAILSRRCLVFTDEQVSLVCRTSHQAELISQLAPNMLWGSHISIYVAIIADCSSENDLSFGQFVNQYQTRHLSYDLDALNAFKGLLSLAPTQSYFGILLAQNFEHHANSMDHFGYGLLWQVRGPDGHNQEIRKDFPSWSWLSRKQCVFKFFGERLYQGMDKHKRLVERALCLTISWLDLTTLIATISTKTLNGEELSISDLFQRYAHLKVIPEQSKMLRLRSFIVTYRITNIEPRPLTESRHAAKVEVDISNNSFFELLEPSTLVFGSENGQVWVPVASDYRYDNVASIKQGLTSSNLEDIENKVPTSITDPYPRQAVLLMHRAEGVGSTVTFHLIALRVAHEDDGQCFYHREGIIQIWGNLRPKSGWENAPRDDVWLI